MIGYPWGALYVGVCLVAAGGFTLARHFLLEPASTHYPKAPGWLRHAMFAFAVAVIFSGLQFLVTFMDASSPMTTPPQPTPQMQFLASALVLYKAAMFANIIRQRCPENVWDRLNRINEKLGCPDGLPFSRLRKWLAQ